MLDYQLLEAFAAVLDEGGFERAAARLCVTQSAVSQRVKQLESLTGKVLVVRESPPRATAAGERLLGHYRQVSSLEGEALASIGAGTAGGLRHLPIAVNTDSLAVWLMDAVTPFLRKASVTLEILVDEQERTLALLKSGAVAGCISSERTAIQGCRSERIGEMRYILAASPRFMERRFPDGVDRASAERAPLIHSDRGDKLQYKALYQLFGEPQLSPPAHYIPSSERYRDAVLAGLGYGLVPEIQAGRALASGALVEVDARGRVEVALYWHRWNRYASSLDELSLAIVEVGGRILGGRSQREPQRGQSSR